MNNFLILAVLAILVYMVYSNCRRIQANRQEARARELKEQENWNTFQTILSDVRAKKEPFLARAATRPDVEPSKLWEPVQTDILRGCYAFLGHNFPQAMAHVLLAQTRANALVAG